MKRPIRTIHGWNVFIEGGDDGMSVVYTHRWVPRVGGRIRLANGAAEDWRRLSLEGFSRKYFRLRLAERHREPPRDTGDDFYDDLR